MELADTTCERIEKTAAPLSADQTTELLAQVPSWSLTDKGLARAFRFKDFPEAMGFVNRIAELAEAQQHHPDMAISYSRVTLSLITHKIGGLSRNDFILAAKIDRMT